MDRHTAGWQVNVIHTAACGYERIKSICCDDIFINKFPLCSQGNINQLSPLEGSHRAIKKTLGRNRHNMDEFNFRKSYMKTVGYSWERLFRFFPLLERKNLPVTVGLRLWRGNRFIPRFFSASDITDSENEDCNGKRAVAVSLRQPGEKAAMAQRQIHQHVAAPQREASGAPAIAKPEL